MPGSLKVTRPPDKGDPPRPLEPQGDEPVVRRPRKHEPVSDIDTVVVVDGLKSRLTLNGRLEKPPNHLFAVGQALICIKEPCRRDIISGASPCHSDLPMRVSSA